MSDDGLGRGGGSGKRPWFRDTGRLYLPQSWQGVAVVALLILVVLVPLVAVGGISAWVFVVLLAPIGYLTVITFTGLGG